MGLYRITLQDRTIRETPASGDLGDVVAWTYPRRTDRVQQMGTRGATGLQDGYGCWSRSTGGRPGVRATLQTVLDTSLATGSRRSTRHATTAAPSGVGGVHAQDPIQPFTPNTAHEP